MSDDITCRHGHHCCIECTAGDRALHELVRLTEEMGLYEDERAQRCDHSGIGLPGCVHCDPRCFIP